MRMLVLAALLLAGLAGTARAFVFETVQEPGPSTASYQNPSYSCRTNYYVSTTGSDSFSGSSSAPWATIQHANDALATNGAAAGSCVNVEPGTYDLNGGGISLTNGGRAGRSRTATGGSIYTGYVVYRCMTLDGCHILQNFSSWGGMITMGASYLWLDGFEIDGNATGCSELPCSGAYAVYFLSGEQTAFQVITNNYIHGSGGGGIADAAGGDCGFILHNHIENNAQTSGYAESGISIWEPHPVSGVTRCGDGMFHFDIEWNVSDRNMEGPSIPAPSHTDGNGIILDTFSRNSYTYLSLVANNVGYGNGGFCIGEDNSSNITFANNTCYDDYLDPENSGTFRGEFNANGGSGNSFINNIAYAVPGEGILVYNIPAIIFGSATAVSFKHNVFYGAAPADETGSNPISSSANKFATNPDYVNPASANFALQSGSAAIGYGLSRKYLPATAVDDGACYHTLSNCP